MAARVHGAFKHALEASSVRELMAKYNIVPAYLDGRAFKARMAGIATDLRPVIEQLGVAKKE